MCQQRRQNEAQRYAAKGRRQENVGGGQGSDDMLVAVVVPGVAGEGDVPDDRWWRG